MYLTHSAGGNDVNKLEISGGHYSKSTAFAASRVAEPGSANSPTPGHQGADAESVGCLHFLPLRKENLSHIKKESTL